MEKVKKNTKNTCLWIIQAVTLVQSDNHRKSCWFCHQFDALKKYGSNSGKFWKFEQRNFKDVTNHTQKCRMVFFVLFEISLLKEALH